MSTGWNDHDPAPISVFHGEAQDHFHQIAKTEHGEGYKTCDGSQVNIILATFKMKIMKEYGITEDAIPKPEQSTKTLSIQKTIRPKRLANGSLKKRRK